MDKTEFIQLHDFEKHEEENVDDILANAGNAPTETAVTEAVDDDFLADLGL